MSLDKISQFNRIQPGQGLDSKVSGDKQKPSVGPSFADTLNSLVRPKAVGEIGNGPEVEALKFSNHAVSRMTQRGIRFGADEVSKIQDAVVKAKAKGAKDTLVLTEKAAMIVNIKNNTVVTVLDKMNMKENVFTNIDSTVMI